MLAGGQRVRLQRAQAKESGHAPTDGWLHPRSAGRGSRWEERRQQGTEGSRQEGVARSGDGHGPDVNFIDSKPFSGAGSNRERGGAPGLLRSTGTPTAPHAHDDRCLGKRSSRRTGTPWPGRGLHSKSHVYGRNSKATNQFSKLRKRPSGRLPAAFTFTAVNIDATETAECFGTWWMPQPSERLTPHLARVVDFPRGAQNWLAHLPPVTEHLTFHSVRDKDYPSPSTVANRSEHRARGRGLSR